MISRATEQLTLRKYKKLFLSFLFSSFIVPASTISVLLKMDSRPKCGRGPTLDYKIIRQTQSKCVREIQID